MKLSICSFSFHRLLGEGKQNIFQYIETCRDLGCTHLQPWNAHFARSITLDEILNLGHNPGKAEAPAWLEPPRDKGYLREIREAAEAAGLPFEMVAVDRAYIYDDDPAIAQDNRQRAYRWMEVAEQLGAMGMRVDAGGPQELSDEVFAVVAEGYRDLISRGRTKGIDIYIENHWGSSNVPENIVRYLDEIEGLKYLFDTNNWAKGRQADGWEHCASRADATHVKTFQVEEDGEEQTVDLKRPIQCLLQAGYSGVWGIESMLRNCGEVEGARRTISFIRRQVEGGSAA